MKRIALCLSLLGSVSAFASSAICPDNHLGIKGKVLVKDNNTLVLSGFKSIGVPNGEYYCSLSNASTEGPNRFARLNCSQQSVFIWGWQSEGPASNGSIAASVNLFKQDGTEFFLSGCLRQK